MPNQLPAADPGPVRIALVGEAPGADEVAQGYPFAGKSGWLLNQWLASAGVSRSQCFVGNVSQCRPSPTSNEFHLLDWNGPQVQEGIAALREDLARFRPHIVVALGNAALHLLRHGNVAPPKSAKLQLFQWTSHVGTWRGSLFLAASDFDPWGAAELRMRETQRGLNDLSSPNALDNASTHGRDPLRDPAGACGSSQSPHEPPPTQPAPLKERALAAHTGLPVRASAGGPLALAGCGATMNNALSAESPCPGPAVSLCSRQSAGMGEEPTAGGACPDQTREKWVAPKPVESRSLAVPFGSLSSNGRGNVLGVPDPDDAGEDTAVSQPRANQPSCRSFKCLATYHPAATFREPSFTYPLVSDLKRAVAEARFPLLTLPERRILWGLPIDEIEARCETIRAARTAVGFDIEGGLGGLQCLSFATSPHEAFVIDLMGECLDRPRVLSAIASVLEDPAVPKVCWNAAYERAILQAVASITLRGYEDGMLAWWERFSELPKGLDFVASLLTREPYWAEGIGWDKRTGAPKVTGPRFWRYNGIDSCVTLEIWQHPLVRAVVESRTPVAFAL